MNKETAVRYDLQHPDPDERDYESRLRNDNERRIGDLTTLSPGVQLQTPGSSLGESDPLAEAHNPDLAE